MKTLLMYVTICMSICVLSQIAWSAPTRSIQISIGVLNLPPKHDGKLKIQTDEGNLGELQLSQRYFTDPIQLKGIQSIRLYAADADLLKDLPLAMGALPQEGKHFFGILSWSKRGKNGKGAFHFKIIPAEKWPKGSMYLLNASTSDIQMLLGKRKHLIARNRHVILKGQKPTVSVPVKIATPMQNMPKKWDLVFASTWRISPLRREFCIFYENRGKIALEVIQARGVVPVSFE